MGGRPLRTPAALLGLVIALLLGRASGCSLFLFNCPKIGQDVASGRTADWMSNVEVGWRIDVTPPGLQYQGTAPCPTCAAPEPWAVKHGFAGLAGLRGSVMVDGLNSAGLSAGLLWLEKHPFELTYSPSGPELGLAWLDVVPYLLGNFETVKEAVAFLQSESVQVSTDLPPLPYQAVLTGLGLRPTQVPLHLGLMDAAGDSVLVEFSPEGTMVFDTRVVTNDPPFPEHEDIFASFMEQVSKSLATNTSIDPLPAPPACYARVPGAFDALARDVRLRMLLSAACSTEPYPEGTNWGPGVVTPAVAVVDSILRSIEIPWGAAGPPVEGSFIAGDTLITMLRDHTNAVYLFRSPGNPRWQGFHLKEMDWASLDGSVMSVDLSANQRQWYGDLTARGGRKAAGAPHACPCAPHLAVA